MGLSPAKTQVLTELCNRLASIPPLESCSKEGMRLALEGLKDLLPNIQLIVNEENESKTLKQYDEHRQKIRGNIEVKP